MYCIIHFILTCHTSACHEALLRRLMSRFEIDVTAEACNLVLHVTPLMLFLMLSQMQRHRTHPKSFTTHLSALCKLHVPPTQTISIKHHHFQQPSRYRP